MSLYEPRQVDLGPGSIVDCPVCRGEGYVEGEDEYGNDVGYACPMVERYTGYITKDNVIGGCDGGKVSLPLAPQAFLCLMDGREDRLEKLYPMDDAELDRLYEIAGEMWRAA